MVKEDIILKDSDPIEITVDGTVVSKLKIRNTKGFAVTIKANNVTIQECDIEGAINLYGPVHGIVIQNNYIHNVNPDGDSDFKKQFAGIMTTEGNRWGNPIMQPMGAYDITIIGNYFDNCSSGAYLVECKGPITFRGNYSRNHRGPMPRGQMVQLAVCDGSTGQILIENNFSYVDSDLEEQKTYNKNGRCGVEDHINCYACMGSEEYPITVKGNYITGCSASLSGSGIMVADGGGSYFSILDNKVYHTGNAGIGLSGGHHGFIKGNRIYQNPARTQHDGRGLQIECYGDKFGEPIIAEDNICYWACGKGDGSLMCATDLVQFKGNKFGELEAFEYLDPVPEHEPPEPVLGLIRPWEYK
jgi:hypothetical protein